MPSLCVCQGISAVECAGSAPSGAPSAGDCSLRNWQATGQLTGVNGQSAAARWAESHAGAELPVADGAASLQEAVADVLTRKAAAVCVEHGVGTLVVVGGVAANSRIRALTEERCRAAGLTLRVPPLRPCTDNGAMIAAVGNLLVHDPQAGEVGSQDAAEVQANRQSRADTAVTSQRGGFPRVHPGGEGRSRSRGHVGVHPSTVHSGSPPAPRTALASRCRPCHRCRMPRWPGWRSTP